MSDSESSPDLPIETRIPKAPRHEQYHKSQEPSPRARHRVNSTSTLSFERRSSFANPGATDRHHLPTSRGQEESSQGVLRKRPVPDRRDSLLQSSSSVYSESSPPSKANHDQPFNRHELFSPSSLPAGQSNEKNIDEPVINAGFERTYTGQHPAFESKLSILCSEFADIRANDYEKCQSFIKRHPEILKVDIREFVRDASNALAAGMEAHAKRCVTRAVMIQECTNSSPNSIKHFFEGLIKKKKEALESFLTDSNDAMTKLRAQVPTTTARPMMQNTSLQSGMDTLSFQDAPTQHNRDSRPSESGPRPTLRTQTNASDPRPSLNSYGQRNNPVYDRRHDVASDGPTVFGPDGKPDVLNDDFRVRKDSFKFFTFGRVFQTVWHQSLGNGQRNSMPNDWLMAVVKEGHGFCWCVPINSYNRKGAAKPGLSGPDRAAHAVIYMEGTEPKISNAENEMMNKRPIAVKPAGLDRKLDEMSRINFGKVHTIEHNFKVKNLGNISRNSLVDFKRYWDASAQE